MMKKITAQTINNFNNRYNIIFSDKQLSWQELYSKIIENINCRDQNPLLYNEIYNYNLKNEIVMDVFINNLQRDICINKNDIIDIIQEYNKIITNLDYYTSICKECKETKNYKIYDMASNKILNEMTDKSMEEIVEMLINIPDNIRDTLYFIGKIFNEDNMSKFVNSLSASVNKLLLNSYDKKKLDSLQSINIIKKTGEYICNTINFNDRHKNVERLFYRSCFATWGVILACSLPDISIKMAYSVINTLTTIEPYLDIADKIKINYGLMLDNKLKENNFNTLISILELSHLLLLGWGEHTNITESIINKLNSIFDKKMIIEIVIKIRVQLESIYISVNNLSNKYNNAIMMILRLAEADYFLLNLCIIIQNRYMNEILNIDVCRKIMNMDYKILNNIEIFTSSQEIKNHVSKTIKKYNNILDDVKKSLDYNIGLKNKNNNFSLLLTSGTENWTETTNDLINNFDISHNSAIMKSLNEIEKYHENNNSVHKLKWLLDKSTVYLNYNINSNVYKLKTTLLQSNILLLFGDKSTLSLDEICIGLIKESKDKLKIDYIVNVCTSLVRAKLINEEADNKYSINDKLELPDIYIVKEGNESADIVKFFFHKEIVIKEKTIVKEIEYDRLNTLKCYITKFVKKTPNMYYNETTIYDNLTDKLKIFKFTQNDVKDAIKGLVKSYYLDEKNNKYRYEKE